MSNSGTRLVNSYHNMKLLLDRKQEIEVENHDNNGDYCDHGDDSSKVVDTDKIH